MKINADLSMPALDKGPEWYGFIKYSAKSGSHINFELIRRAPPISSVIAELQDKKLPFDTTLADVCFDLQKEGCLIFSSIGHSSPLGAMGGLVKWERQKIKGKASYLLVGDNSDFVRDKCVSAITLKSFGLETLFASAGLAPEKEKECGVICEFQIKNLAKISVFINRSISNSTQKATETRFPSLEIELENKLTGLQAIKIAQLFDRAFSFLCGIRFKPRPIELQRNGTERFLNRKVYIGGQSWTMDRYVLQSLCKVDCTDLEAVLKSLVKHPAGFSNDINRLLDCLEKFTFSEDILFWSLPLLEKLLHKEFVEEIETDYEGLESDFFRFLDENAPKKLVEFSKNHLKVVERKGPNTKKLVERAIAEFNSEGIAFPANSAGLVWNVRNAIMHGGLNKISSENIHIAADVSRTLSYLIVLKRMQISPSSYRENMRMISAECGHIPQEN